MAGMESLFSSSSLDDRRQQSLPERDTSFIGSTRRALGFGNDPYSKEKIRKRNAIKDKYKIERRRLMQDLRKEKMQLEKRLRELPKASKPHDELKSFFKEQSIESWDKMDPNKLRRKTIQRFELKKAEAERELKKQRQKEFKTLSKELNEEAKKASYTQPFIPVQRPPTRNSLDSNNQRAA